MGMHCVPLYDTLGANAVEFILNHSEAAIAFASADKLPKLIQALPNCKGLKTVVYWGEPDTERLKAVAGLGIECISLDVAIGRGQQQPAPPQPPKPTDLCTIMYTSGTTGDPKGVMLKHSAVVCTLRGLTDYLEGMDWELSEEDLFLSYLPLAHIFDRAS
jgi:long-chain acyl-CoA synthetase